MAKKGKGKKKKHFTRKQLAAQRKFAAAAKSGKWRKKSKKSKSKKKGELCFNTLTKMASYMKKHHYKVVKK